MASMGAMIGGGGTRRMGSGVGAGIARGFMGGYSEQNPNAWAVQGVGKLMDARQKEMEAAAIDRANSPYLNPSGVPAFGYGATTDDMAAAYQASHAPSTGRPQSAMPYNARMPGARAMYYMRGGQPRGYSIGHFIAGLMNPQQGATSTGDGSSSGELQPPPGKPTGEEGTTKPGGAADTLKAGADMTTGPALATTTGQTGQTIPDPGHQGYNAYTGQYGYSRDYGYDEGKNIAGQGKTPRAFKGKAQGPFASMLTSMFPSLGGLISGMGNRLNQGTQNLDQGYVADYYLGPRRAPFGSVHG